MIKNFSPKHLKNLDVLECFKGEPGLFDSVLDIYEAPGSYVRTLFSVRGEVLAVFGGLTNMYKTMSVWTIADKKIKDYPITYHKALKNQMDLWIERLGLIRLQSVVEADNVVALKQHKKWGFEVEGTMRKSSWRETDQILLARVL